MASRRFWVETLGCPKNSVDSDKVTGSLLADGYTPASGADDADLVVVNTCAFVEEARQESIETILALSDARRAGTELVVTGCMAERYGAELADELPEVDRVVGFGGPVSSEQLARQRAGAGEQTATGRGAGEQTAMGRGAGEQTAIGTVPVAIGRRPTEPALPALDLLNMPRPAASAPWAYLKVAEGCDRKCGFCAIPSFRGKQRSRVRADIVAEARALADSGVREIVLIAQDLASYGRDQGRGEKQIVPLVEEVASIVDRVRLLYLYPSELTDGLIDVICRTGVPYFDLSLQHVSRPLVRRMRRWGHGGTYLERIRAIREREPDAAFRSNFIVGYPGETEEDHDELLAFVEEAQLDWCGFFAYSEEAGTYSADLDGHVPESLVQDRLAELRGMQDDITAARRDALVGRTVSVLVDEPGVGRSHREAPEIDGIITVPESLEMGTVAEVTVTAAAGPEVHAALPAVSTAVSGAGVR